MPKKPARQQRNESPIVSKQQELIRREEEIRAKLNKAQTFLQKAPDLKAEARRKEQRTLIERFEGPSRIDGPVDFRIAFVKPKSSAPPPRLRKERSKAPLVTFLLMIAFVIVIYYAFRVMWQG